MEELNTLYFMFTPMTRKREADNFVSSLVSCLYRHYSMICNKSILRGCADAINYDIIGIENLKALVIEICNDNIRPSDDNSERYNNIKDVYILKNNISEADLNSIGDYFSNASFFAMDYNEKSQSECFDNISKKYFD